MNQVEHKSIGIYKKIELLKSYKKVEILKKNPL